MPRCTPSEFQTVKPSRALLLWVITLILVMFYCSTCLAQISNGSIKGFVTDPSGSALPKVQISVSGPALMGKRTVTSDEQGFYRLLDLPPGGDYVVTAEAPNFAKIERPNILIRAGITIGLDLQMKIGQVNQVIQVTAQAPLLEAEKAEHSYNVSGEFIRNLPLAAGHDWWDAFKMLPGVLIWGGEGTLIEAQGASPSSNVFTLDGFDISGSQQNFAGETAIPIDAVSDVKITTAGRDATARMAVGAAMSIVTRSGGNDMHGSFTTDMQPKKFNDTNVPGGTPADVTIYQFSGSLGGPVVKDRLWYFGSYRGIRQINGIARTAAQIANLKAFQPDFEPFSVHNPTHQILGKVDYKLTNADQVTFTYQYNITKTVNNANDPKWTRETSMLMDSGGPMYGLSHRRFFGQKATLESQAGYNKKPWYVRPQGEGPQVTIYGNTNFTGLGTGAQAGAYTPNTRMSGAGTLLVRMGNVGNHNFSQQDRLNINSTFSYFGLNLLGTHDLKVGMNLIPINKYTMTGYTSNDGFGFEDRVLVDANDISKGAVAYHRQYQNPIVLSGVGKSSKAYGYFVQDSWRPHRRLVVNVGFRWDKSQAFDTWGQPTQAAWHGGPRFGVAYNLTSDRKNIVNFSYSRMFDAVNNLYSFNYGSLAKGYRDEYDIGLLPPDPVTGIVKPTRGDGVFSGAAPDNVFISPAVLAKPVYTGLVPQTLSPGLKQPRTDEWTLGYQRELPWKMTVTGTFINRDYKNKVVSYDTNIVYENGIFKGVVNPDFNSIYEIRNTNNNWYDYRSLELSLHKNLSHKLQFLIGYTLARQQINGTWDDNDPAGFLQPDAFPNKGGIGRLVYPMSGQINSYTFSYYNSGTPPHSYKMSLTYEAPLGITVGVNHVYQMGQYSGPVLKIIAPTSIPGASVIGPSYVSVTNSLGVSRNISNPLATNRRFYYNTRAEGQMQADTINTINLRAGKTFTLAERHRVEAAVQLFNLLNTARQPYIQYPSIPSVAETPQTFFKQGYQNPRAGQITLRWNF